MLMPFLVASCASAPSQGRATTLSLSTAPTLADLLANYRAFLASDRLLQVGTYSPESLRALYGSDVDVGRTVDTSFNSVSIRGRTPAVIGGTPQSGDKQPIGEVSIRALLLNRTVVSADHALTIDGNKAGDPARTILYETVTKIFAPELATGKKVSDDGGYYSPHGSPPPPPPPTHPRGNETIEIELRRGVRTIWLTLPFGSDGALKSLSIGLKNWLP